ncbi:MAG: hypothetical protein ACOZB0_03455 [Pseudomonadota bacterium]
MSESARNSVGFVLIFLALLAIYLPSLGHAPVFDDRLLTSGELFSSYGLLSELKPRWLSYGSFVWVRDLLGEAWPAQRVFNLVVHGLVVIALWGFYRTLLRSIQAPADAEAPQDYARSPALLLGVGFFALNPVAVYAVAYLIQRSILMATLFALLSLWAFTRALGGGRPWLFGFALAAYGLAVLSKEHAVLLPLAAVPVYLLVARPAGRQLALMAGVSGALVAIVAGVLAMRYGEIIGKPFDEYSRIYLAQLTALGEGVEANSYLLSIVNQMGLFFKYGLYWLVPNPAWMSIDLRPPFPLSVTAWPQVLGLAGYLGVLVGGFYLVVRHRDWRALVGVSVLMPALLFMTEFSTVWVQDPFVLYRSYLWAIGLPGLVFFLFHGMSTRTLASLAVVIGMALAWLSLDRVDALSTPEKVWSDAIAKLSDEPNAVGRWFPYLNRAIVYLEAERPNEAIKDFAASDALGDQGMGAYNIGALLAMAGRYPESLQYLDQAAGKGFDQPSLDYQRGVALYGVGRMEDAWASFEKALGRAEAPDLRVSVLSALIKLSSEQGRVDRAKGYLAEALRVAPDHPRAEAWRSALRDLAG